MKLKKKSIKNKTKKPMSTSLTRDPGHNSQDYDNFI
jgi:hypothetical protein